MRVITSDAYSAPVAVCGGVVERVPEPQRNPGQVKASEVLSTTMNTPVNYNLRGLEEDAYMVLVSAGPGGRTSGHRQNACAAGR